ncbi:MAG: FISUMP domain-containing protein [Bacteroidota bacterium]|nr:FISUMP domain-containing protein [Bacteroidota bacterium]
MKRSSRVFLLALGGLGILALINCEKKDLATIPVLTTNAVSVITSITATCGGNISDDGGASVTERGVCWSTEQTPTEDDNKTIDGDSIGNFISSLTGLQANTSYYVRAYATNSAGTGYGKTLSFTTNVTATDIDGNVYNTIKIGSQVWMAENLNVTRYRNGDLIPNVTGEQWDNLITGAYCFYNNSNDIRSTYGLLYNWYAVADSRNICPEGWHIPTMDEWETLADTGLELKESGTTHWASPNFCRPNSSGFEALPGGNCGFDGEFNAITLAGYWWTADEEDAEIAWMFMISRSSSGFLSSMYKWAGLSIRCIKD